MSEEEKTLPALKHIKVVIRSRGMSRGEVFVEIGAATASACKGGLGSAIWRRKTSSLSEHTHSRDELGSIQSIQHGFKTY